MKRQALTLAATTALGLGTLLIGQARADDTSNAGQTSSQTGAQSGSAQSGGAQGETANASQGSGDLRKDLQAANDPDKLYIVMAAIDNQCEIQLGQLAQQKAQDEDVKKIAQKIVEDHQKANQQLQQVAQQIGVQIPQSLPMIKQQEMTVFQSLNGKQFDQQYISHLRAAHAKCVSETTDVAQLAQNDQVKQYASKQLPILEEHAQRLQKCAMALGLPSSNEAQTAGARIGGSSDQNQNSSGSSNTENSQNNQGQTGAPNTTPPSQGAGQIGGH